jgi:Rod binding domain-containing protein
MADSATAALSRAGAASAYAAAAFAAPGSTQARARTAAQSFEGVLVNNLLGAMFSGVEGEGPMGVNGTGGEAWRSMLVEQISTSVVRSGGIGIASEVYRELIRTQEAKS